MLVCRWLLTFLRSMLFPSSWEKYHNLKLETVGYFEKQWGLVCGWLVRKLSFYLFIYHESSRSSSETLETTLGTSWCHYPEGNSVDVVVVHILCVILLGLLNWEGWDERDLGVNEKCIEHFGKTTYDTYKFFFDRHTSFIAFEACIFQEFLVHICPAAKITVLYRRVSKC